MSTVRSFREWRSGLPFRLKATGIWFGGLSAGLALGSLVSDRSGTAIFIGGISAFGALLAFVWRKLRDSDGEA